jgi:hypothetical protein
MLETYDLLKVRELMVTDHNFTLLKFFCNGIDTAYGKYYFLNARIH